MAHRRGEAGQAGMPEVQSHVAFFPDAHKLNVLPPHRLAPALIQSQPDWQQEEEERSSAFLKAQPMGEGL